MSRLTVPISVAASLAFAACSQAAPSADGTTPPVAGAVHAAATATALAAPSAEAASVWVMRMYDRYKDDSFSPFDSKANVFDADIQRELDENERLTPEGEMGAIEADPICSCQDPTGLTARVTKAVMSGPDAARVEVTLNWPLPPDPIPSQIPDYTRKTVLHLVMTPGGWRVHDIDEGAASFLKYLKDENAARRTGQ
jgi:hypothetical protein